MPTAASTLSLRNTSQSLARLSGDSHREDKLESGGRVLPARSRGGSQIFTFAFAFVHCKVASVVSATCLYDIVVVVVVLYESSEPLLACLFERSTLSQAQV